MPLHLLPSDRADTVSPDSGRPTNALNRRQFLASVGAGASALACGLGAATPRIDPPADAPEPGDWYALVSDTHIATDPAHIMFRQNMAAHLRDVVADILSASKPPGAVVIDGDLALWDGQPGDYGTLLTPLEPLRAAKVPIHMALGNHDDRSNFRTAVPSPALVDNKQVSAVDLPGLRFVILDSLEKAPQTPGVLGPSQLDWLRRDLDAHPQTPTIVFHHHHPEHVPWSTVPGLSDSVSLMEAVRSRRQVKALVFGHTHIWTVRKEPGHFLINLPAVAYAFDHHQPLGYCRLKPDPSGASIELKCVGGNRKAERQRLRLDWSTAHSRVAPSAGVARALWSVPSSRSPSRSVTSMNLNGSSHDE